jgi:predicted glycosyltransferase
MPPHAPDATQEQPASSRAAALGIAPFRGADGIVSAGAQKNIWIDIDNSPHVPFFLPIIQELRERGHRVLLTARDSYQVCELLKFHRLDCKVVGSHWGRNRFLKTVGTMGRAARLVPLALREKPDLGISLVSRAQLLACKALGIPVVVTFDYEFVLRMQFLQPDWIFVPAVMPDSVAGVAKRGLFRYSGLKEDVYVPSFQPNPELRRQLGINDSELLVTVRPPATQAHYHHPDSDKLMSAALHFLAGQRDVRVVLLPRNRSQSAALENEWRDAVAQRKILIPGDVLDGLNLIWNSDLVISGGGTMNREAAALGVPVYSIFRGRIGAVDQHLAENGRLVLLERAEDICTKIELKQRKRARPDVPAESAALRSISEAIISIAERQCLPAQP